MTTTQIFRNTKPIRGVRWRRQVSLWNDRIKEEVNKELASKGWTERGRRGCNDYGNRHHPRQPTLRTFDHGFPGWRWGGFGEATTYVDNYEVGTLVIDMFDTEEVIDLARISERHPSRQARQSHEGSPKIAGEDVCPFPPVHVTTSACVLTNTATEADSKLRAGGFQVL